MLVRVLVSLLCLILVAAPTAGFAADKGSQGKKAAPKPSDVDDLPGDYYQLETMWVPVLGAGGHPLYQGLVIRLWPGRDTRVAACLATQRIEEDILTHFNDDPIDLDTYTDTGKLVEIIKELAAKRAGDDAFQKVEVFHDFITPDRDSELVSRACK